MATIERRDMAALLGGVVSREELARQRGLSTADVEEARRWFLEGLEHSPRSRRRPLSATLLLGLLGLVVFGSTLALGQATCMQTLPMPLVTMCPDDPARAADVNGNFRQLVTWVEQKLGPVGSPAVDAPGSLSVATTLTVGGQANVSGALSVGALTASSATIAGSLRANSIDPATRIPSTVIGGGTLKCNSNSSIRRDCVPWGVGVCGAAGCSSINCTRGTQRQVADGSCFTPADGSSGYCYHYLCLE